MERPLDLSTQMRKLVPSEKQVFLIREKEREEDFEVSEGRTEQAAHPFLLSTLVSIHLPPVPTACPHYMACITPIYPVLSLLGAAYDRRGLGLLGGKGGRLLVQCRSRSR